MIRNAIVTFRHVFITILCILSVTGCSGSSSENTDPDAFTPDWESLQAHQTPEWLMDGKFGIHFHWGIYSVPAAYDESYSRNMYRQSSQAYQHHLQHYGSPKTFGYKNFITFFKAEQFDPNQWAALFAESGARFAGPVAEHADGFAMWDSGVSTWNAAHMGPRRDVVGELERAIRDQGLKFIASLHHHRRWGWFPTYDTNMDTSDPMYAGLYGPVLPSDAFKYSNPDPPPSTAFQDEWLAKTREVIDGYHPDLLMFDDRMSIIEEQYRQEMVCHFYQTALDEGRDVALSYHNTDLPVGVGLPTSGGGIFSNSDLEYGRRTIHQEVDDDVLLVVSSIDGRSNSYRWNGYYKPTEDLIAELVKAVSRNGVYILNITPRADGVIPDAICTRLRRVGQWLAENGEAVYGTRAWDIYGESPGRNTYMHERYNLVRNPAGMNIRFTQSPDGRFLYAFLLDEPGDSVVIGSLDALMEHPDIDSIVPLGSHETLHWTQNDQGLHVQLPDQLPGEYVRVLRIAWKQDGVE